KGAQRCGWTRLRFGNEESRIVPSRRHRHRRQSEQEFQGLLLRQVQCDIEPAFREVSPGRSENDPDEEARVILCGPPDGDACHTVASSYLHCTLPSSDEAANFDCDSDPFLMQGEACGNSFSHRRDWAGTRAGLSLTVERLAIEECCKTPSNQTGMG